MLQVLRRIGRLTAPDPAPDPSRRESAAAQEPGRSRAQLLGTVSHQLRTPLTSIIGSTATLLDHSRELNPAEVRRYCSIIAEQAHRMDQLISDLLDARSTEAGPLVDVPEAEPPPYVLGDLEIHYAERRVSVAGQPVQLTATEYELLRVLSRHAGRVLTYGALRRHVWAGGPNGDSVLVRTYVKKLRRKLRDDPKRPCYIVNERGVGYRMARPDDA
ncbi:MAG: winged helix-turn-helix domain-containing protein [Immundisolibacterales bacterium]|nr:winged helix-turn-helix domain-containing protein [Immundisolibacterales bacterium]